MPDAPKRALRGRFVLHRGPHLRNRVASVLILVCASLYAHGDLHDRIVEVSRQIDKHPDDARLYLKRGDLHRAHEAWPEAWADYEEASRRSPGLHVVDRSRGQLLLAWGKPDQAKAYLDRYLRQCPEDGDAYLSRARVLYALGSFAGAVRDFTRTIDHVDPVQPQHYVERARAERALGEDHLPGAIRGLDEGIARLGSNVALELLAADLEVDAKRYDAALARVDRIAARTPRKHPWLARRGSILEVAGRPAAARAAYADALKEIQSLPAARRNTRATRELEERVRGALERLSERTAPAQEQAGSEKGDPPCSTR